MKRLITFFALAAFALTLTAQQSKAFQKPEALIKKGEFRLATAEYEKLAQAAEKSKKAPPFDVSHVYNRLGECYLELREFHKSDVNFTKAQEKGSKEPKLLQNYGDALLGNN
ncbi:MAG: hypothetical protein LBP96_06595, partial [Bacteroidales bacterium]|nr:hypothetical protein [Bacteroidales bacterium]